MTAKTSGRLRGSWLVVLVLAWQPALAGCSPSEDEVTDAVGGLPGVISARPSCHEFLCTVAIEAEPTAPASDLADMIAAARSVEDVGMVRLSLTPGTPGAPSTLPVYAELHLESSPASEDVAVSTVLAWAAGEPDLSGLSVTRGTADEPRVIGAASAAASIWPLAREAWPLVEELDGATLVLSRTEHLRQQSLTVTGSFPEELVAVAERLLPDESGVTGVLVEPGRLMVGVINRDAATRLRPVLAGDPRLATTATEVVVTTNVLLGATAAEPGTGGRLEPVLAALDSQPEVLFATIQGNSVHAEVDGLRSMPRLVEHVRRRAGDAFVDTVLVLDDPDAQHRVEITPDGDDAVVDLMLALLPTRGLRSMTAVQEPEPDPGRTAVSLTVNIRQPGRSTGTAPPVGPAVTRLARALVTTPGSAASYLLAVTIQDAEGRASEAVWRVDRTPDGLVLGEVTGTQENQAEVRAAWERGVG